MKINEGFRRKSNKNDGKRKPLCERERLRVREMKEKETIGISKAFR